MTTQYLAYRSMLSRARGPLFPVRALARFRRAARPVDVAAASKALDRAGFTMISANLQDCLRNPDEDPQETLAELQKLFLS